MDYVRADNLENPVNDCYVKHTIRMCSFADLTKNLAIFTQRE